MSLESSTGTMFEFGEQNAQKVNVWCRLLHDSIIRPVLFRETTVTQTPTTLKCLKPSHIDSHKMLFSRLQVRESDNGNFPGQWIGTSG